KRILLTLSLFPAILCAQEVQSPDGNLSVNIQKSNLFLTTLYGILGKYTLMRIAMQGGVHRNGGYAYFLKKHHDKALEHDEIAYQAAGRANYFDCDIAAGQIYVYCK
ncbi:hypothetical protein, partial [Bacteroides sp. 519]|uniref:hypothetical protein n=1 Tax=Bacteroides sp. 519 TaxID=2302937 RepID=UPI0013D7C5A1